LRSLARNHKVPTCGRFAVSRLPLFIRRRILKKDSSLMRKYLKLNPIYPKQIDDNERPQIALRRYGSL
jgi:hypothetical protein